MTITWEQVLAFLCEDQTMAITSLLFLAFFAAVALINYALPRVLRPYFLLAASYGFFCYDPVNRPLVWVIAAATVLTWLCGLIIGKVRAKPVRVLALAASVGFGIGILVYYKYWNLLADTVGGSILSHRENLLAPLGLSYFTFAAMSYTIDVYKRRCRVETNLLHYALFVSFFPTLINGPIERYPQMRPQIRKSRRFSYGRCAGGAFRMLWGYTKKMVLADNLSHYVSLVYGDVGSMSGPNLVAATVLFAVQLYMDFSGCCDIALGAARILGYDLIENFQSPFEARTFNDFWRRWHFSLGAWMRDYVFYPFALCKPVARLSKGTKKVFSASFARALPAALGNLLVFLLVGVWHGATSNYILWGLYNGVILAFTALMEPTYKRMNESLPRLTASKRFHVFRVLRTFVIVNIGWFFDRCAHAADAFGMLETVVSRPKMAQLSMETLQKLGVSAVDARVLAAGTLLLFAVSLAEENGKDIRGWLAARALPIRWAILMTGVLAVLLMGVWGSGFSEASFIYFNF